MSEPSTPEDVVDGDRLIAFVNAVKNMGDILGTLNVRCLKDAFLVGAQHNCIDKIIDTEKKWKEAITAITDQLEKEQALLKLGLTDCRQLIAFLSQSHNIFANPNTDLALAKAREFSALLDNIERHRKLGTIDMLCQLSKL